MALLKAKWVQKDPQTLIDDLGSLKVKLDPAGDLEATDSGIRVKPGVFLRTDGTVPMVGDIDMGGYRITNLAPVPESENEATSKQYVDAAVSNLNVRETEVFSLSSTDLTNKYVQLQFEPIVHSETLVEINGAPGVAYGVDYTINVVNGVAYLSWDGLGLDGKLQAGDILAVTYDRSNVSGGVHDKFVGLEDTPNSYTGYANTFVKVNPTENGLIFAPGPRWEKVFTPEAFTLDDTDIGVDAGKLFGLYTTVDFFPDTQGSVYFQFDFPYWSWDINKDIRFDFIFSCSADDPGTVVSLKASFWITGQGQSEDPLAPDYSITEDITVTTDMIGKRYRRPMSNIMIPATVLLTSDCSIVCKLTRDVSVAANYSGYWQLLHIIAYQL